MGGKRYPWVWDYDIDAQQFDDILAGRLVLYDRLDRDWAAVPLIEYAGYCEMMRRIGYADFTRDWPRWRQRVCGDRLRASLNFVAEWIAAKHPELLAPGSGNHVD
ncbi:MAG: hypothetical protein ACUVRU_05160 [Anaerolineae bacterium]